MSKNEKEKFQQLLSRYQTGESAPSEINELFKMLDSDEYDHIVDAELKKEFDKEFNSLKTTSDKKGIRPGRLMLLKVASVAAASVLIVLLGLYIFSRNTGLPKNSEEETAKNEAIVPGHSQAILTDGDGKIILLDSLVTGRVAILSGTVASVTSPGELTLSAVNGDDIEIIKNNTISIPTGGFFKIILPDGSKVWLNSESELSFPSKFIGETRSVALKGEGYFEVMKNTGHPFKVHLSEDEEVEVLGTVFNIMAYNDEPSRKITLLEGSIKLSIGNSSNILHPLQQAIITGKKTVITDDITIEHEVSWKNGLFDFQNQSLQSVLRQLSRWYNAKIVLSDESHEGHYTGSIRKTSGIRDVLRMLEATGDVNFLIVGNNIIVKEN